MGVRVKLYLVVAKGKHRGLPILVDVELFAIGSGTICQLRAVHPEIGAQHCAFVIRGREVFLRDLGSGHPTILNGKVLPGSEEWPVHRGDRLAVGPLAFKVTFQEKQLSPRDLAAWALQALDDDVESKSFAVLEIADAYTTADEPQDRAADPVAVIDKVRTKKGVVRDRIRIGREGPVTVVRVNEIYLVEAAELFQLKQEMHTHLDLPNLRVLIDLKNVRRMSSAAAKSFGDLANWLHARGSTLAVCRLRPELAGLLGDLPTAFDFKIYQDKSLALSAKW